MMEGKIRERGQDDRWMDGWIGGHVDRETDKLTYTNHYVPGPLMDMLHTFI